MKKYLFLILIFGFAVFANGQDMNWKKHLKEGEASFKKKNFAEAAYHFEAAYKKKVKKKELIYNAAESYFLAGDFVKAAKGYKHLLSDFKAYPFARLKYARALKQSGEYGAAETAFVDFSDKYHGDDKEIWERIVRMEIKGCDLGKLDEKSTITTDVFAQKIENINSDFSETSPYLFSDNILYFTTSRTGESQIYRSQKSSDSWQEPEFPDAFSFLEDQGFSNGVFTPDRKRFYFSMCGNVDNWRDTPSGCRLYVMKFEDDKWSEPEKLPEYINEKNAVVTHPFVTYIGQSEVLFFASNMEGTKGNMDIWFSVREIDSENNDFTFPENAGENVNTIGNDISPFYDSQNGILFFSSNAQVTIGGYDIFQSTGGLEGFEKSNNLGLPINSSSDDYYFKLAPDNRDGYFVSNRPYDDKISDNIYKVTITGLKRETVATTVAVVEKAKEVAAVHSVVVETPVKELVNEKEEENIELKEKVQPEVIVIEETKEEADIKEIEKEPTKEEVIIVKEKVVVPAVNESVKIAKEKVVVTEAPPVKQEIVRNTVQRSYYIGGTSKRNPRAITMAPKHAGEYYKIQLHSVKYIQKHKQRYENIREYGNIETEYLIKAKMTRVLLSNVYSYEEAKDILKKIKPKLFTKAYIIKYIDGERIGRVR